MADGFLKSASPAPETKESFSPAPPGSPAGTPLAWEGVPIDIFRMFSVDLGTVPTKDITKIRDVYEWARTNCNEPTIGNIMNRISSLKNQLGYPETGEKMWDKVWNWTQIQRRVDDLQKRQEALRRTWR